MKFKTSGFGLIILGILLLGAQLVLYLGVRNLDPASRTGEQHIEPPTTVRTTPLAGVFGAISLIAGIALATRRPRETDDPRDGLTLPEDPHNSPRQTRG